MDALQSQDQTARELVMEHGAHYLLTVKNNQPTPRQNIDKILPDLAPDHLPAAPWPKTSRLAWGIEDGTHPRLDVSLNEDRCRVRQDCSLGLTVRG
jgi:hypothetical protein